MKRKDKENLTEKVTIRCSPSQKKAVQRIQAAYPSMSEADVLRHLIDAILAKAEREGMSAVFEVREGRADRGPATPPPLMRTIPLYSSELPEPSERVAEGPGISVDSGAWPLHAVALEINDNGMDAAGYAPGAIVIIDTAAQPREGDVVAVDRYGRTLVRRFHLRNGRPTLSTQSREIDETMTLRSTSEIRGVVVGRLPR